MRGDLLDWHERGEFIQLGSRIPGALELCIGDDDGLAAVELSERAAHALHQALADYGDDDQIEGAVDAALEEIRGELEDITEERDRLADEVKELRERLEAKESTR
jgi:phosphoglycolate phosphatase-like HAD superfamily hydrolase